MSESSVESTPLVYGHLSGTLMVSENKSIQPEVKKIRLDRPCLDELEGYVLHLTTLVNTPAYHSSSLVI